MREPTKEEINLFKQIAKKYRKGIDYGDWYWHEVDEDVFLHSTKEKYPYVADAEHAYIIPLWTISDCLEFLREKGYRCAGGSENKDGTWWFSFTNTDRSIAGGFYYQGVGKTPLEACLKPVLAVVEENKK